MNLGSFDTLHSFFNQFSLLHYKKRELIMRAEDIPSGVFFIEKGYVRLYTISKDGTELTFTILKPGSYFSMMWALGGVENRYNFEALTEVTIHRAPKEKVLEFLEMHPEMMKELMQRILHGLDGMLTVMENLLFGKAYDKVAALLLLLAKRFGTKEETEETVIPLALTHQDIASMTGLTRETTSMQMSQLEKEGVIHHHNHLVRILDLDALQEIADTASTDTDGSMSL